MKSDHLLLMQTLNLKKKKKIDGCANNPEESSTAKIGEHIPCEYSMSTIWVFHSTENKHRKLQKLIKMVTEALKPYLSK